MTAVALPISLDYSSGVLHCLSVNLALKILHRDGGNGRNSSGTLLVYVYSKFPGDIFKRTYVADASVVSH